MKNQTATAIASRQIHIETIARVLTISGESGGCVLLKNPHLFSIRNGGGLSKTTISANLY